MKNQINTMNTINMINMVSSSGFVLSLTQAWLPRSLQKWWFIYRKFCVLFILQSCTTYPQPQRFHHPVLNPFIFILLHIHVIYHKFQYPKVMFAYSFFLLLSEPLYKKLYKKVDYLPEVPRSLPGSSLHLERQPQHS